MKIYYPDGCEQEWRQSLSPWQLETLANLHRQGKGHPDGTNHGDDERWCQAGAKVRWHSKAPWRRVPRDRYSHEGIVIRRKFYGYEVVKLRQATIAVVDPETLVVTTVEGWETLGSWYVGPSCSGNFEKSAIGNYEETTKET